METDTNVDYGSSEEDYGSDEHFICKDKVTKWYKTPHVSKFAKTHRKYCEDFSWPNKQCQTCSG